MSDEKKTDDSQPKSASESANSNTEKKSPPPRNQGKTFSGSGVEKKG